MMMEMVNTEGYIDTSRPVAETATLKGEIDDNQYLL